MKRISHNVWKRIVMALLGIMLMCLMGACASGGEDVRNPVGSTLESERENEGRTPAPSKDPTQTTPEPSEEPPQITPEASIEPPQTSHGKEEDNAESQLAAESYKAILIDNGDFKDCGKDGEVYRSVNIETIKNTFTADESDTTATVPKFAIVDLDGDGMNEIVLWIRYFYDEGFEVLHYREGEVYGYHFWYRAFMNLKADGTFIGSGGAADTSIMSMKFTEDGYVIDTLYQSHGIDAHTVQYYANGEPISEEEFDEAEERQDEKPDVVWYERNEDNVNLAFENRF